MIKKQPAKAGTQNAWKLLKNLDYGVISYLISELELILLRRTLFEVNRFQLSISNYQLIRNAKQLIVDNAQSMLLKRF